MLRKFVRSMLRMDARTLGIKESTYVAKAFDKLQIDKYGVETRRRNQKIGSKKCGKKNSHKG